MLDKFGDFTQQWLWVFIGEEWVGGDGDLIPK